MLFTTAFAVYNELQQKDDTCTSNYCVLPACIRWMGEHDESSQDQAKAEGPRQNLKPYQKTGGID